MRFVWDCLHAAARVCERARCDSVFASRAEERGAGVGLTLPQTYRLCPAAECLSRYRYAS